MLELNLTGQLTERDGALVTTGAPTTEDAAAAARFELLCSQPEETSRDWLLAVREQALGAAFEGLTEKGLVREEGRRVLGVFGSVTRPVTAGEELTALRGGWRPLLRTARPPTSAPRR
ncbi:GPP34 family phosphoprotein [Streptomyces flaveolus]|uniref:GPP34 family phosphoprotein n=1 Tax=Streptomyces flaveolus TaxID=67297 RepID=UPI00340B9BF3